MFYAFVIAAPLLRLVAPLLRAVRWVIDIEREPVVGLAVSMILVVAVAYVAAAGGTALYNVIRAAYTRLDWVGANWGEKADMRNVGSMFYLATSRWERVKRLFQLAIATAFALVPLVFSTDRFRRAFTADALDTAPLPQLSIVLLVLTILLVLGWYRAVSGEMQMIQDYTLEFIPAIPKQTFYVAVGIGAVLGLLVFFSYRPLVYSALYATLKLFEIWAIWLRDVRIRDGLKIARDETAPDDERRDVWVVLEGYYLGKPQIPLATTELCLGVVALVLSVYGELLEGRASELWFSSAAYAVIFLALLLNAVVYTLWRRDRDKALGESYS